MRIRFSRELSQVHDAMDGLVQAYKENYKAIYKDYDLQINKAAEEAIQYIRERVNFQIPCSDLLFSLETGVATTFTHSRRIPPDLTLDSFADHLESLTAEEIRSIVLAGINYAGPRVSYEEILRIAQDEEAIRHYLRKRELPASIKWETMEFLSDTEPVMRAFTELVREYVPIYKMAILKNRNAIDDFADFIQNGVEAEGEAFITNLMKGSISFDSEEVIAGTLFFSSRSITNIIVDNKLYVYIGMDIEETVKLMMGEGALEFTLGVLKNLSDKTRFRILELLKEREYYGQEIAEKVGITMATVSYHMNYLIGSNLVILERVGQKGYYTLKRDTLRECIRFLSKEFDL